jgi:antitoxin (DNA-binding transcriptional repressor) of toxin-antitoxin stability system
MSMRETTFTELRNQAKHYFDLVESGEIVRVIRNGKPIAEIHPIAGDLPSWKRRPARPLVVGGAPVSRLIVDERSE